MSEQDEREALANLIPLGFTERDPYRDAYEAADAILAWVAERGYRKRPEPEWEYVGENSVYRRFTDKPDVAAGWIERGDVVRKRTKAVPAGPWVPVEEQHAAG